MVQVHRYRYKYPGSGTGTAECQQKQIMVQVLWFWYRYSRVPAKTDHGTGALVLVQVHEGASRRSRRDRSSYRYTGRWYKELGMRHFVLSARHRDNAKTLQ